MSEALEQKQLLTWVKIQYKDLLFVEDLGGIKLTIGQAKKVKQSRCRRGCPDMSFMHIHYYSTGVIKYVGLAIEFKKKGENPQKIKGGLKSGAHLKEQYDYLIALRQQGWLAVFATGFKEAQDIIKAYMSTDSDDLLSLEPFLYPKIPS